MEKTLHNSTVNEAKKNVSDIAVYTDKTLPRVWVGRTKWLAYYSYSGMKLGWRYHPPHDPTYLNCGDIFMMTKPEFDTLEEYKLTSLAICDSVDDL